MVKLVLPFSLILYIKYTSTSGRNSFDIRDINSKKMLELVVEKKHICRNIAWKK